jgi:sulfur-carrier protein adenylyltransferase/sulfurtransferase
VADETEPREIDAARARVLFDDDGAVFLDVREPREWSQGRIPRATHLPVDDVHHRAAAILPDRSRPVVAYCAVGRRSVRAADTLMRLGYEHVVSLAGGIEDWFGQGHPVEFPAGGLAPDQRRRYSRHLLIPEVGEEGQQRLLDARILLVGVGGLGSPASLYLAAAGIGTVGIVDADVVDDTNLQRQIVHSTARLGEPKVESAAETIRALNPDVEVKMFEERLTSENVDRILGEGWDVIVDGADNFPTRYLVNDASFWHEIPVVHGSIYRFEGQVTVFRPGRGSARGAAHQDARAPATRPSEMTGRHPGSDLSADDVGPCYRCLFPAPPPPELAPSCAEGGVLGVLPGVIGSLQASEALKLVLRIGEPLVGRLLLFDALSASFTEVALRRDPECPVCGEHPTITSYVDYVEFCGGVTTS